jgi:hypothetical protein
MFCTARASMFLKHGQFVFAVCIPAIREPSNVCSCCLEVVQSNADECLRDIDVTPEGKRINEKPFRVESTLFSWCYRASFEQSLILQEYIQRRFDVNPRGIEEGNSEATVSENERQFSPS